MSRMSAVAGYCCKSIFTPARGIIVGDPAAGDCAPCFLPTPSLKSSPSSSSPWCRCLAGGVSWFDPPNLARGGDLGGVLAVPLLDLAIESAIGGLAVETCIASGTGTDDDARRVAKLVGGAFAVGARIGDDIAMVVVALLAQR